MNLRDLQYIVTVADTGNFGKAAEICNVSQSTLSIQIKKLEEYLGVQLFERSNKKVMLTAIGKDICERTRHILHQAEEIRQLAKSERDPFCGELTLGAFPTLAPYLFPLCSGSIKKNFPKLLMKLVEEKTASLLELLESGRLDCALIAGPVERQGIKSVELFHERFFLAVPKNNPLSKKKKITDEELAGIQLLLLDEGHCLRSQALEICHSIGSGESIKFRATSLETLRQMVAMGDAITLIPELAVRHDNPNICYIPLQNKSFGRKICLCWRETSAKEALFQKLAEVISAAN